MSKRAKAVLIIIGLLVLAVIAFITYTHIRNQNLRNNLEHEGAHLQVPPSCTFNYGHYQTGSIDIATSLQVEYKCNTMGSTAHDAIIADLTSRGYKLDQDKSIPVRHTTLPLSLVYEFTYSSKNYTASYDFHPNQPQGVGADYPINVLQHIQVTGISLRLQQAVSSSPTN